MDAQDTIEQCIKMYPSLFHQRTSVLNHLFLVGGNGYEWHEGKLVAIFPDENRTPEEIERGIQVFENLINDLRQICGDTDELVIEWAEELSNNRRSQRDWKLLSLKETVESPYHRWYPASTGFCCLDRMPDNVTQDWAEAALELCNKVDSTSCDDYYKAHKRFYDEQGGIERATRDLGRIQEVTKNARERLSIILSRK